MKPVKKTASLFVCDFHAGAGRLLAGRANSYEDFLDDEGLALLLAAWLRTHDAADEIVLYVGGDFIDFNSIEVDGLSGTMPTETAALRRAEVSLNGHPVMWDAFRRSLATDLRARIVILIGNHDLDFAWPSVQAKVAQNLSPADPSRVTFKDDVVLDGEDGQIAIIHGDRFDRLNANPASFIRFLGGVDGPHRLNVPVGARMSYAVVSWLRRHCRPLGFIAQHGPAWALGFARAIPLIGWLVWQVAIVGLRRYLADWPKVQTVVSGHVHLPGDWDLRLPGNRRVRYLNAGTAVARVHLWRFWRPRFTEWTPVEIVSSGDHHEARLLRFDPATGLFSEWR